MMKNTQMCTREVHNVSTRRCQSRRVIVNAFSRSMQSLDLVMLNWNSILHFFCKRLLKTVADKKH